MAPPAVPAELLANTEYWLNTMVVAALASTPPPMSSARLPATVTVVKMKLLAVSEERPPPPSAWLSENPEVVNLTLLSLTNDIPPPSTAAVLPTALQSTHVT